MTRSSSILSVLLIVLFTNHVKGFQSLHKLSHSFRLQAQPNNEDRTDTSRRNIFHSTGLSFMLIMTAGGTVPTEALASPPTGPTQEEFRRIQEGYRAITYLLDNFEKETTVCRENGGECKRNADAVRRALGLRSTTDPLFQIEKVFSKVKDMDNIDLDKLESFFQATEDWNTAVNMSNSMAFISQFGEFNPGGGKDEVLKYLEESRKQVILAQKALKDILNALDLSE